MKPLNNVQRKKAVPVAACLAVMLPSVGVAAEPPQWSVRVHPFWQAGRLVAPGCAALGQTGQDTARQVALVRARSLLAKAHSGAVFSGRERLRGEKISVEIRERVEGYVGGQEVLAEAVVELDGEAELCLLVAEKKTVSK